MKKIIFQRRTNYETQNIDTMREVRLWIGQIIVPAVMVVGSAMAIPEVRQVVATKANQWKESVEKKIKKN